MKLIAFQFVLTVLPQDEEDRKRHGQSEYVDKREKRISNQQAEGEFEIVEEHRISI
jgi:hypothetical protein